ncbi:hypothetical protein GCM10025867_42220 [Frondihabitans sucicola]|uniref:DUF4352 domain-containing protein n=1 Tax=Frondihabitans sucicola TaxID=1268041 RepID=A0ABN6Y4G8_9MICO|nr:hypothetical protein [Frondihabitans sucicola]BDZ51981.1 hypothetical protein GCM10025867_42220 [Frondihabitans sucicola]
MVAPLIKAFGALVVGTPVALALGLTARSLRKQEDAAVPVLAGQESPLVVTVFSNYLDKKTHEHLAPTSFKKGYVVYDVRVENRTDHVVKGVHVELLAGSDDVSGHVRLGDVPPRGHSVFAAKKPWNQAFEHYRSSETDAPRAILTWKTAVGRRRVILPLAIRRVLGETPSDIRRRRREKAPVVARVMS